MTLPPSDRAAREAMVRRALAVAAPPAGDPTAGDRAVPPAGGPGVPAAGEAAVPAAGDPGDVPVGAVVYGPDGTELATGRNERELTGDPTGHAEIVALRGAAAELGQWRLAGCVLAVTLEPCTMCAGAIVLARLSAVVFGAWDPKAGAVGSLWDVVRDRRLNHRPEVYGGVLEAECAALLREFFSDHR